MQQSKRRSFHLKTAALFALGGKSMPFRFIIIIPISYSLVCNGLQQLIDDNKALAVIGIKSSSSSYSRLFIFPKEETAMELHIPKFKVVKRIELTGSIIATAAMNDFKCEGEFNDLYFSSSTFEIRKGDVLAKEDTRIIYVDDTELEKPILSQSRRTFLLPTPFPARCRRTRRSA